MLRLTIILIVLAYALQLFILCSFHEVNINVSILYYNNILGINHKEYFFKCKLNLLCPTFNNLVEQLCFKQYFNRCEYLNRIFHFFFFQ